MTRKQKSYKELETENTRGKKRYLERLVEDEEAAQRIEEFLDVLGFTMEDIVVSLRNEINEHAEDFKDCLE